MTLNREHLAGSLRDAMLDVFKSQTLPWPKLSEGGQSDLIALIERQAVEYVGEIIDAVTSAGISEIDCSIHKVGVNKETVEAKISVAREDEMAEILMKGAHGPAKIAFANSRAQHLSVGDRPQAEPDQSAMFRDEATVLADPEERSEATAVDDTRKQSEAKAPARRGGRRKATDKPLALVGD